MALRRTLDAAEGPRQGPRFPGDLRGPLVGGELAGSRVRSDPECEQEEDPEGRPREPPVEHNEW
ncbi:MAG: hypothetical protein ABEJ71_03315 [Halodesulfurarchaeum sp.]